jgi:hypothetical protein
MLYADTDAIHGNAIIIDAIIDGIMVMQMLMLLLMRL